MPGVCLSSWCASFTTALPFSSSSPTERSLTPRGRRSNTARTYTEPRCAKPTSSRASQSTLAPPSSTRTGCTAVGNRAPMAARWTPSCSRSSRVAAAITAPVLPAEMNASLAPCFWSPIPTAIEERGLPLTAANGFSPIPTTSGASMISRRSRSTVPWVFSAASMSRVRPTSWIRNVAGNSRSAWTAPSTSTRGASSPPMASSATRITVRRPLPPPAARRGNSRRWDTPDAGASNRRTAGRVAARWVPPCNGCGGRASSAWKSFAWVRPWNRPLSVAELVLQGGQPAPALVRRGRAPAGARVQVRAAARAQPAAVVATHDPLWQGQQELLSHRHAEIDRRRVTRQGIGIRVLQGIRILGKQGVHVRHHRDGDGGKAAPAFPGHPGAERGAPVETPFTGGLQAARHAHRLDQGDGDPLEQGVAPCELALRVHRATGELPQVDL